MTKERTGASQETEGEKFTAPISSGGRKTEVFWKAKLEDSCIGSRVHSKREKPRSDAPPELGFTYWMAGLPAQ